MRQWQKVFFFGSNSVRFPVCFRLSVVFSSLCAVQENLFILHYFQIFQKRGSIFKKGEIFLRISKEISEGFSVKSVSVFTPKKP